MNRRLNEVWLDAASQVLLNGARVAPRGKVTRELLHHAIRVDMRRPVLTVPERKLSYQFMAAEAYWILSGDDTVAGIEPYNRRIAEFSDDGLTFFGAYGPKVHDQLDYVVSKLRRDPDTRQAGMTLWRENPPETKDVPCTVAIFFSVREDRLNAHVFMRSSDVWLGLPYDVFNFSMLAHLVCGSLNHQRLVHGPMVSPGTLFLTAASSHLYEPQWESVLACLDAERPWAPLHDGDDRGATPTELWMYPSTVLDRLAALRGTRPGDPLRWWEARP